jgi:cardiolipin synthase
LDVAVEDAGFAHEMEQMYLRDLDNATEIVLGKKNRVRPVAMPESSTPVPVLSGGLGRSRGGSASQLTAGAIRVSNTVGAALTSRLVLGAAEAKIMMSGGVILLGVAALASLEPLLVTVPFVLIAGWIGISLLIQAYHLHKSTDNGTVSDNIDDRIEPFISHGEPSDESLLEHPHEPAPPKALIGESRDYNRSD